MEQDGLGTLGYGANKLFGNPILPMGSNSAKGQVLLIAKTGVTEEVGRVHAIVCMYVLDFSNDT
jgi:hypothetical protein